MHTTYTPVPTTVEELGTVCFAWRVMLSWLTAGQVRAVIPRLNISTFALTFLPHFCWLGADVSNVRPLEALPCVELTVGL